ncbi:curlin subunit CsgB [Rheinheimera maricola]|uniref:Curlin subunit CsgB n=1 Tax=Rheinheimera maricola TaxID=2793282 RepID=A0ABS7X629_9GAMM|nr:curlin subunit CsgB [Rheinheimera maricola]
MQVVYKSVVSLCLLLTHCQTQAELSVQLSSMLERQALASVATIAQYGELNTALVSQSGDAHFAVLLQQGVLNQLLLRQEGSGHQAHLKQSGGHNSAFILQRGDTNFIQVEQWGSRHLTVEQTGAGEAISIVQY